MASSEMDRNSVALVSLGMFIIDTFSWTDTEGRPTGKTIPPQIGGGGTYAAVGARIWLPPRSIGMIIDRGHDFPNHIQRELDSYGSEMWYYRDNPSRGTTRSLNSYRGDERTFQYLTPRIQVTPNDYLASRYERAKSMHVICAPSRYASIYAELEAIPDWNPLTIYEPVEYACVHEELPSLIEVLPHVTILSPNAKEALTMLGLPNPSSPSKELITKAARMFIEHGVGLKAPAIGGCDGYVIIRCAELGCFVQGRSREGAWIDAFWSSAHSDGPAVASAKIVDVTGAGNSFLGGLAAGLELTGGDVYKAVYYASVSASFVIEQAGLPQLSIGDSTNGTELWNGDSPQARLDELMARMARRSKI